MGKGTGWLFLDEPTHNLDVSTTESLGELLRRLPEEGLFDQIILITHNEELQSAATRHVYLLDRDKAEEGSTRVSVVAVNNA